MKIEVLFPEFCNLFGDMFNIRYLEKCLPRGEFINTAFSEEPRFLSEEVNLIYLGPMTEGTQEKVVEKFRPYKEKISALIDGGTAFLFTGNAMEILGTVIEREDGSRLEGLGIFPFYAKQNMMNRHNSTFLGSFQGSPVMGFKSQFTMAYPENDKFPLFQVEKGVGMNKKCKFEGIRKNNFFGTYTLGPVLLLNPDFTRQLLTCMGVEEPELAFEDVMEAAYEKRLKDFREKT